MLVNIPQKGDNMTGRWLLAMGGVLLMLTSACNEQKDTSTGSQPGKIQQVERGKEVYTQVCAACHGSGLAGAPKFGDREAWAPRINKGIDALVSSAVHGKGTMPARGGQAGLSDQDIRAAIEYMVVNSR